MIRFLRDTLGQRIAKMLPAETKADRAQREGCVECPRDHVRACVRGTTRCATHHERHRDANARDRRRRGIPVRGDERARGATDGR